MVNPHPHRQALPYQEVGAGFRQGSQLDGIGGTTVEIPPGMQTVNETVLKGSQDQVGVRAGGAPVWEKQAELSRLPAQRKEGIGHGKSQTLVGIVEIAMHF
jgi:hypothetical protein